MAAELILREGREKSLLRRHPWVFSGAVAELKGPLVGVEAEDVEAILEGTLQEVGARHHGVDTEPIGEARADPLLLRQSSEDAVIPNAAALGHREAAKGEKGLARLRRNPVRIAAPRVEHRGRGRAGML